MKYCLILLFGLLSIETFSQVSNTKVVRVSNATTIFSEPLSEGNILIDLGTDRTYLMLKGIPGTESLSSVTENVDYKEIANTDYQTLDVAQLTGTNLELSLSDDGEATHQIDLSSLSGTDDQTAGEVSIADAGAYFISPNVEGALQEIGGSIVSGGDGWGSDVVISDNTLTGDGTSGNVLKVDTTVIGTKYDIRSGTIDAAFESVMADTMNVKSIHYSDTYWDDLQVNIASAKLKPSFEPKWVLYKGGYVLSFENNSSHEMYFTAQLSHKYKDGTDLSFHVHLVYPDGTTGNVDWTFTYSWANIGDNYPDETTVNTQTAATGVINKHTIGEIAAISGTGKKGSSVLLCSLTRNGSNVNDDYGNSVYMVALDFHYQIDKPGSNNIIPD